MSTEYEEMRAKLHALLASPEPTPSLFGLTAGPSRLDLLSSMVKTLDDRKQVADLLNDCFTLYRELLQTVPDPATAKALTLGTIGVALAGDKLPGLKEEFAEACGEIIQSTSESPEAPDDPLGKVFQSLHEDLIESYRTNEAQ